MVSFEYLKEWYGYHPDGWLTIAKQKRSGNYKKIGDILYGTVHDKKPYRRIWIKEKQYYLHRLIFLWHNGFMPVNVDHINQDCTDNRIENLRAATPSQNAAHITRRKKTTGFKGVTIQNGERGKCYCARITHQKVVHYLGHFLTKEEAAHAYDKKAKELFGAFACPNFP